MAANSLATLKMTEIQQPAFSRTQLGANNTRTWPQEPSKPQYIEDNKAQAKGALVAPETTPTAFSFSTFNTNVRIFLLRSGSDPGSTVEMEGWISFLVTPGFSQPDDKFLPEKDLPKNSSWPNEGGGYGLQLLNHDHTSLVLPASFRAALWEQDDTSANDAVLDYRLDFANPANIQYADGREWYVKSKSADGTFEANLVWRVTQLS
ncbi:MAG: hypothetical protein LQ342_002458 [Letrouitia transgressa]|nr:MAG: hypothetical protein LQ342_002458 [Letrouitia transgressa]